MEQSAEIKKLTLQLRNHLNYMPRYPPTSRQQREKYDEWENGCREIEKQLRQNGVDL